MPTEHTTLAILVGGQSSRLGTDKGLYRPLGDESLIRRTLRLWSSGSYIEEILVVTKDAEQAELYRSELRGLDVRVIADESPTSAAAWGIVSALSAAKSPSVMCAAVDQVAVRPRHFRALLAARSDAHARPVAFAEDADFEPLPSLWPKAIGERLAANCAAGMLSIRSLLRECDAHEVRAPQYAKELRANCNTRAELDEYFGRALVDPFGRRLHYLRFSMTEACNLSCAYCLPEGFPEWYRHKAKLSGSDIDVLLRGFRQLGFRKVRFTGGEPTVHPDCMQAVGTANELGYEKIALSTNGLLIRDLPKWRDAGLTAINVSLDSLNPDEFAVMAKSHDVERVLETIDAAIDAGIETKVNTVLMRSINGRAIEPLIEWALKLPITLRFIELMPTHLNRSFSSTERVSGTEIREILLAKGLSAEAPGANAGPDLRGPAQVYTSPDHVGRIGLIDPLSNNFCAACNRLRVTARGKLKLCLFGDSDLPLDLTSPESVAAGVRAVIHTKPERHHLESGEVGNVSTFRTIGG